MGATKRCGDGRQPFCARHQQPDNRAPGREDRPEIHALAGHHPGSSRAVRAGTFARIGCAVVLVCGCGGTIRAAAGRDTVTVARLDAPALGVALGPEAGQVRTRVRTRDPEPQRRVAASPAV